MTNESEKVPSLEEKMGIYKTLEASLRDGNLCTVIGTLDGWQGGEYNLGALYLGAAIGLSEKLNGYDKNHPGVDLLKTMIEYCKQQSGLYEGEE